MRILVEVRPPLDVGPALLVLNPGPVPLPLAAHRELPREQQLDRPQERKRPLRRPPRAHPRPLCARRARALVRFFLLAPQLAIDRVALARFELAVAREALGEYAGHDEPVEGVEGERGVEWREDGGRGGGGGGDEVRAEERAERETEHHAAAEEREDARARTGGGAVREVGVDDGLGGAEGRADSEFM